MCENNNCEGLQDVLCTIIKLQKQGKCLDEGITSCSRPILGSNTNAMYNTRPISFYTCPTNTLWEMPYTLNEITANSSVFRAEAIDGCCCTCRVLVANEDGTYTSTNSFFTINLNCIGALRCLPDTYIDCL